MRVKSTDDENDDIMDTSTILEQAADFDDFINPTGETDMTAKKKAAAGSSKPAANEGKAAKKAPAKKTASGEGKAKGKFGPRELPEGYVGITQLAKDSKLKPAVLRRKLRGLDGIEKGEHGWAWKTGSKDYDKVLKAVTVKAEKAAAE